MFKLLLILFCFTQAQAYILHDIEKNEQKNKNLPKQNQKNSARDTVSLNLNRGGKRKVPTKEEVKKALEILNLTTLAKKQKPSKNQIEQAKKLALANLNIPTYAGPNKDQILWAYQTLMLYYYFIT